jgi:GDP-L-fucose synthase
MSNLPYRLDGKRVWVAGHKGMVGSALVRRLQRENVTLITAARSELDLRCQEQVEQFVAGARPQAIFLAAARVGGILANDSFPAAFLYDNLAIATNVIEAARRFNVEKLLNLGSTCVYPKFAPQPIREDALLSGPLEPTNQWYAVAKIAAIKLCDAYRRQYRCDFISAMPTNLYGPNDNFDLDSSHVIPALIAKFARARADDKDEVVVWGTGTPRREFLHVDDCADALVHLMTHFSGEGPVNIGAGTDVTIRELAQLIAEISDFRGALRFDPSRPDGTPRKLSDCARLHALGWSARIPLRDGVAQTYAWFEHERRGVRSRTQAEFTPVATDNRA